MLIIDEDEHGPWIDLEHSAIRPIGPTRFKLGDKLGAHHFGGSTLYGLGKIPGVRGFYAEAWLSAPASRASVDARFANFRLTGNHPHMDRLPDFDSSMRSYLVDLAVFKRGNPDFDSAARHQSMVILKNAREKYLASIGYGLGKMSIEAQLLAEGRAMLGALTSVWVARDIETHVPDVQSARRPGPRV